MLTQSQLKDIFLKYSFRPLKRFGENYLIDANIKNKITNEAHIAKGNVILEIGPGLGALTIDLAKSGAFVYAVEKDRKAFAILKDLVNDDFPNLKIFNEDILKFDLKKIHPAKKIRIIGNLPYYITTPIIEYIIASKERVESALITIQREVANRFLADPGTKDYGAISCFVQYHMKPSYIYTIKRTSFYPRPEVDSSLIRLDILPAPSVETKDEELFFKVARGAFNQRRKSLLNSLSRKGVLDMPKEKLSAILKGIGIDPSIRPESLSLADFTRIADALV